MAAKDVRFYRLDIKVNKADIQYINDNIRFGDRIELNAMGHTNLYTAIKIGSSSKDMNFIAFNAIGIPLCVFGLTTIGSENGRLIWCIGSNDLDKYSREFILYSKQIIGKWLETHDLLYNYVSVKNIKSIRWLASVGAAFGEPFLINGELFKLFTIRR